MSLTLSARERELLDMAVAVISAPQAYERPAQWRAEVRRPIAPLLDGDVERGERSHEPARRGVSHAGTSIRRWADRLPEAAVLCGDTGALLHESPSLRRLLAAEPLAGRLRRSISDAARALARRAPSSSSRIGGTMDEHPISREVRGARVRYELRGSLLDPTDGAARDASSIFLVRAAVPRAPSDAELRDRFSLTVRETEVLRLLAVGRCAREISAALGLSYHTARHHVEHVRAKLHVRTRAAVAAAMLADT